MGRLKQLFKYLNPFTLENPVGRYVVYVSYGSGGTFEAFALSRYPKADWKYLAALGLIPIGIGLATHMDFRLKERRKESVLIE